MCLVLNFLIVSSKKEKFFFIFLCPGAQTISKSFLLSILPRLIWDVRLLTYTLNKTQKNFEILVYILILLLISTNVAFFTQLRTLNLSHFSFLISHKNCPSPNIQHVQNEWYQKWGERTSFFSQTEENHLLTWSTIFKRMRIYGQLKIKKKTHLFFPIMTTSHFLVSQVWLGFFTKISQYTKPYLASLSADGRNATHNTAAARGEAAVGNTKKMTTMKEARDRACVWVKQYILWGEIEKLSSILVKCLTIKLVRLSLVLKIAKGIILGFLYQCCLNIYWEFVTVC